MVKKCFFVIAVGCLLLSCNSVNSKKRNGLDPLEETLRATGANELLISRSPSCIDTCLHQSFKFAAGLVSEFQNYRGHCFAYRIGYDTSSNLPNVIELLNCLKYKYTGKIKRYNGFTSVYWNLDSLNLIEDSTTYFYGKENRLVKIYNSINFLNEFTIYKFDSGFRNLHIVDTMFYNDAGLVMKKLTEYKVNEERLDIHNVVPLRSEVKYEYSNNMLVKIKENYSFVEKSKDFEKSIIFNNCKPSYYTIGGEKGYYIIK